MDSKTFLSETIGPSVIKNATAYANKMIDYVENSFTAVYDEAVKLRDGGMSGREARDSKGMHELGKRWDKLLSPMEPMFNEICDKELSDYYKTPYGGTDRISSYTHNGRVYRRGPNTEAGILKWAEKRADEKAEFFLERLKLKLSEVAPNANLSNLEFTNVKDEPSGRESIDWSFDVMADGKVWQAKTHLVYAGGHNIQVFHTRFTVKIFPSV